MELDVKSTTENVHVPVERTPFAVIRGRTLLASLVLATILTLVASGIIWGMWGIKPVSPLGNALSMMGSEAFLLLCIAYLLHLAKLWPAALLGPNPPSSLLRRSMLFAFPLAGLAIAGNYLLFLPLSYFIPGFASWCLFSRPPMIFSMTDYAFFIANVLNFLTVVLIGPVVEEFFFRGLLLTRWSLKWNARSGILVSSLVFALLHPDNVIGTFFVGCILSILYIQTKSLLVPISVHIAYNGLAWILAGGNMLLGEPYARNTLAQWQSFWWVGLLAGLFVVPWLIRFVSRHFPKNDWRVPYLALQEST